MAKSILKKNTKKSKTINFTNTGNFTGFNNSVIKHLLENKEQQTIEIIDYIYPITKLSKSSYQIKDHINLSGVNPLKGPEFISLTNIYKSRNGIVVCGLKEGIHLNSHEKNVLSKANINAYCYNLIPTAIFATFLGLKIKATGVIPNF